MTLTQQRNDKRILLFISSVTGGAGKNAVIYANFLVELGFDVLVICGSPRGHSLHGSFDARVALVTLSARRGIGLVLQLASVLRRYRHFPALVIGPSNISTFAMAAILSRHSGEVTLRLSNSVTATIGTYSFFPAIAKRALFAFGLKRTQRVIAVTRGLEDEPQRDWSVERDRITYVPNGVAVPDKQLERPSNQVPILFCPARLHRQKDHDTLLRAFAKLQEKTPSLLKLAGDGPQLGHLKKLAAALGVSDRTEFLGYVQDVGAYYGSVDLTVLSSRHEGFPNVLVEALAHGCPVVATDCPTGPSEIISDAGIGHLARVGDPASLCAALEEALSTDFDRAALQARAHEFSLARLKERLRVEFSPIDRNLSINR
jgi:glycosyltransferase involved in cell wall biosynthesis